MDDITFKELLKAVKENYILDDCSAVTLTNIAMNVYSFDTLDDYLEIVSELIGEVYS